MSALRGKASICLHDYELPDGYIFIDERSENAGMVQLMMVAGVISGEVERVNGTPLCKMTDAFTAYIAQYEKEQDDLPYYMK